MKAHPLCVTPPPQKKMFGLEHATNLPQTQIHIWIHIEVSEIPVFPLQRQKAWFTILCHHHPSRVTIPPLTCFCIAERQTPCTPAEIHTSQSHLVSAHKIKTSHDVVVFLISGVTIDSFSTKRKRKSRTERNPVISKRGTTRFLGIPTANVATKR